MKPDLLVVTWHDISSRADWQGLEEVQALRPEKCITVGWLVQQDDDQIIVADSVTESGEFGGTTVIPRAVIQKTKKIAKSRPESFLAPSRPLRPAKSRAKLSNRAKSED